MTLEEKIATAQQVRSRDRFGPVSQEELAALTVTAATAAPSWSS